LPLVQPYSPRSPYSSQLQLFFSRFIFLAMRFSSLPLGALASLLALATACKKDSDVGVSLPDTVSFTQAGLYPEGTQYDDQRGLFLVSSQTAGRIGQVTDAGTYSTFADDPLLVSTIGLRLDAARNRLLAAVSDPGYNPDRTSAATKGKLAALAIFNSSTGTKMSYLDLGAFTPAGGATYPAHFANDIAVDGLGNAYITDSFAPIIYQVDAQGAVVKRFLENAALAAPTGKFGLNGIVYHPSGYLLVAKSDEGKLLKIPITTVPGTTTTVAGTITTVTLPAGLSLSGDDGLQLLNNTTLLVVCNAQGKVYRLTTTNDFGSVANAAGTAGAFDTGNVYPTTLARRADSVSYVLHSYLSALQANQTPAVSEFKLQKVSFK
jgi:sugar lactone lactonase YvrE